MLISQMGKLRLRDLLKGRCWAVAASVCLVPIKSSIISGVTYHSRYVTTDGIHPGFAPTDDMQSVSTRKDPISKPSVHVNDSVETGSARWVGSILIHQVVVWVECLLLTVCQASYQTCIPVGCSKLPYE